MLVRFVLRYDFILLCTHMSQMSRFWLVAKIIDRHVFIMLGLQFNNRTISPITFIAL